MLFTKRLKVPPGDLVRGICISDFVLCCHWACQGIFTSYIFNITFGPDSAFCIINAAFATFFTFTEYGYNCCFILYIVLKFRSIINSKQLPCQVFVFHFAIWLFATAGTSYLYWNDMLGLNDSGTCS